MQVGKFVPVRKPTLAERLLGTFQDEAEDRTLISTVYFLSPPNQDGGTLTRRGRPSLLTISFGISIIGRAISRPPRIPHDPARHGLPWLT